MAFLGWFDGELRKDAWFDAELQPKGWFDTEIIDTVVISGTVQAICINPDGSLTFRLTATGSDNKLYLNNGSVFARLSPTGGDKILTLVSGQIVAT